MDLRRDVGHVKSRFCPFGESVSVECKIGARFHVKRTIGSAMDLNTPDGTPRSRLRWKLDLVDLEIVLILTQDRCMVYAEPTLCLEVILDTPDRTPR